MTLDDDFAQRRAALFEAMPHRSVALLRTSDPAERTFGTRYRYRPRSSFLYLTNFREPQACAALVKDDRGCRFVLFCQAGNEGRELLQGRRGGPEEARRLVGADEAHDIAGFEERLPTLLEGIDTCFCQIGIDLQMWMAVGAAIRTLQDGVRAGVTWPTAVRSLDHLVQELRFCKSTRELERLRRVVDLSVAGHRRAMASVRPDLVEWELEAEITHEFMRHGGQPAYPVVVCSSTADCVMHHREDNTHRISAGALVIVDAGAELDFYSADLTRTFPVAGRFSPEQRLVYELVLQIQDAMIARIRPGASFGDLQRCVEERLVDGLLELGLLEGDRQQLLSEKRYKPFFPHNVGHWVGMDVHDEITYGSHGRWRPFVAGAVLTVEPALYVRPSLAGVDARWHGIGVHIEDMILVTDDGCEVLSRALARTVEDIERAVGQKPGSA